jgi:hypothetical protein
MFDLQATCLAHLITLDSGTKNITCRVQSMKFIGTNFRHIPVASTLLDPNIFLYALFNIHKIQTLRASLEMFHSACWSGMDQLGEKTF